MPDEIKYNTGKLKRIDEISGSAERAGNVLISLAGYGVEYQNTNYLQTLRDKKKPFILLPRHQDMKDILLEGRLLREQLDRKGYYIMKSGLPAIEFLRMLGGIVQTSTSDIKKLVWEGMKKRRKIKNMKISDEEKARLISAEKISYKQKTAELKDLARIQEEEIYNKIVPEAILKGEIIVSHPEGTRNKEQIILGEGPLENLLRSQEILGQQMTFVPLNIIYQRKPKKVILKIGPQITVPDNGVEELKSHWLNAMK